MNIRLKRIIKIGLPLIVFFINIVNCSEVNIISDAEENIISDYEKKIQAVITFAYNKGEELKNGIDNIADESIKRIDNLDSYLEFDILNNIYKVREDKEEELLSVLLSLMDKQPNHDYFECLPQCNDKNHFITLPTCHQRGCKYAFYNHLLLKLSASNNKIPCLLTEEPKESKKGHLCFFSLGKVLVDGKNAFKYGGIKKKIIINYELNEFLNEFGEKIVDGKGTSLKKIIEDTISGGGDTKDFNTGRAKYCRNCNTVLWKDNCLNNTNIIICSGCKEKKICFKCLYDWDDKNIDHNICIDSQDCDLFQKYGTDKIFVGKKNKKDLGYENFKTNRYYHPRRCYNCKGWAGKDRKCNHITCVCGAQWCWFCGDAYDDDHWNYGSCKGLWTKGDYNNNFDASLNDKMKLNDDDLLPWERKENPISKEEIQKFINLKKPILNDQLCCNCFLDCLDKIKNCFSEI